MTPDKVEAALARVSNFVKMMKAKPIGSLHDEFYGIHSGTEWEASLRFSDIATLTSALAERERDAARYRWLQDAQNAASVGLGWRFDLDTEIDAAMKDTDYELSDAEMDATTDYRGHDPDYDRKDTDHDR